MAAWKDEDVSLLEQGIRHCERCPARVDCQCPIPPEAKDPTEIMVVGETPEQEDDLHNRPFFAKGGRTLQRYLSGAGISRQSIWMTYLSKCYKDGPHDPINIQTCAGWLDLEFELVRPKLVILLGDKVVQHFYPAETPNVETIHGEFRMACTNPAYAQWQDTVFAITYNPYLLKDPAQLGLFLSNDAERLGAMCQHLKLRQPL